MPQQWKEAHIRPVPKVAMPVQHTDFCPISVTPILTRMMERVVVCDYLYPAFHTSLPSLTFLDQFTFRPTRSTSAAIISLLSKITDLLQSNPYVIVSQYQKGTTILDFNEAEMMGGVGISWTTTHTTTVLRLCGICPGKPG